MSFKQHFAVSRLMPGSFDTRIQECVEEPNLFVLGTLSKSSRSASRRTASGSSAKVVGSVVEREEPDAAMLEP